MTSSHHHQECCSYCGLPLGRTWWRRHEQPVPEVEPQYCCYGCELAEAATKGAAPGGELRTLLTQLGLAIFLSMNVMVFSMELWTQDVYKSSAGTVTSLSEPLRDVFRYLCLLLSLPVLWLLGRPLAHSARQSLRQGRPGTDLLIIVGVGAATLYSTISVFRGAGHIYFEVACVVLVMVTLGRWLDATGKLQTTAALDSLAKLLPDRVRLVRGLEEVEARPEDVVIGDQLRVRAGERFACDGRIVSGMADVDEQFLTGESRPVSKGPRDAVHAGATNLDGDLVVNVTAAASEGTLQRMIELVREARSSKGYHQRLADRVSTWFLPVVAVVAVAAFLLHAQSAGFEQGLLAALAVSLIACPCALGLATPMAVWAALGRASQAQILIRSGEALERLAGVRALAIDKTGTLTTGVANVTDFISADPRDSGAAIVEISGALAFGSNHPLSQAIVVYCREHEVTGSRLATCSSRTVPGRGVTAEISGGPIVYLGNLQLMREAGLMIPARSTTAIDDSLTRAQSLVCIGWSGRVRGLFLFDETPRSDAALALDRCRAVGLHVSILTGDHPHRASALASSLGVDVEAELQPADKVAAIKRLRQDWGPIAMVGDGINDAAALVASDVGFAMGCGADVSRNSAAICLLGNQLHRVPETIELAHKTVTIIRQNLFWSFFYNVAGIGLACAGWLNPVWASVAMVASSVLVIGNSLRLRGPTSVIAQEQVAVDLPTKYGADMAVDTGEAPQFSHELSPADSAREVAA